MRYFILQITGALLWHRIIETVKFPHFPKGTLCVLLFYFAVGERIIKYLIYLRVLNSQKSMLLKYTTLVTDG